jgi:hypothetical protein
LNRRELLAAGAVGLGSAWGLGCGSRQPKPVDFAEVTRVYQAKDYDDVQARWTRHGKLIRDIGTVLELWATYKSWDFRQAYIEAYSELYGVPESERRLLRQAQLEAARASYEFHVIAQSTEHDWNNLHEEDTVWKISLADAANREVAPTRSCRNCTRCASFPTAPTSVAATPSSSRAPSRASGGSPAPRAACCFFASPDRWAAWKHPGRETRPSSWDRPSSSSEP